MPTVVCPKCRCSFEWRKGALEMSCPNCGMRLRITDVGMATDRPFIG